MALMLSAMLQSDRSVLSHKETQRLLSNVQAERNRIQERSLNRITAFGKHTWQWTEQDQVFWATRGSTGHSRDCDHINCAAFGLLTAVILKSADFWVVRPCSVDRARRFRRTYCLYFQGRIKNSRSRQQICWFLVWFTFLPWIWRRYIAPRRRSLSYLHGVTTQKMLLF
jgi:hypothetical protein